MARHRKSVSSVLAPKNISRTKFIIVKRLFMIQCYISLDVKLQRASEFFFIKVNDLRLCTL